MIDKLINKTKHIQNEEDKPSIIYSKSPADDFIRNFETADVWNSKKKG